MNSTNPLRLATGVASYSFLTVVSVATAILVSCLPAAARACNTPVYRYAMYNWPSAPYYAFYFHHGQVAKEDEAVNKTIAGLSEAAPPGNMVLEVIDVSKKEQVERLPEVVKKTWKSNAKDDQPLHVVFSPWGVEQFAGRLDEKQLKAMIDSPVRKRLGGLFDQRHAAVLLILTGPDEKTNKQAEKVAREVVAKAAGGEVPVAGGDDFGPDQFLPQAPDKKASGDDQPKDTNTLKLAVLKVARTDAAEKRLVNMLLAIEPDLREEKYAREPMIFAVYGRGRAMPPYVGKGITVENVIDCIAFLTGPCSCMIKDQNPGMDLLMQWDWDATAEKMAADDPQFAGGPWGYQEFPANGSSDGTQEPSPQNVVADAPDGADPETEPVAQHRPDDVSADVAEMSQAAAEVAERPQPATEVAERPEGAARTTELPEVPVPTPVEGKTRFGWAYESFAAGQAWKLGIGVVAVGTIVVLAAGLVLLRRHGPA